MFKEFRAKPKAYKVADLACHWTAVQSLTSNCDAMSYPHRNFGSDSDSWGAWLQEVDLVVHRHGKLIG